MKTPITYYGGKQTMLKHIRPLIPDHHLYTEAFCGGCAVFFDKEQCEIEVINDLNSELINFYQTCISDFEPLKHEIDMTLHSRQQHEHAWYIYNQPTFFTKIQRAWAVWVLSKMGFAGQLSNSFGFDKTECRSSKKVGFAKDAFSIELKGRLERVTIENDDAFKVINRFDCEGAFHFVDPPYVGTDMSHYSNMFNDDNLKALLELLSKVKGKFMLTMFPNEVIKGYIDKYGWVLHEIERQITACKAKSRRKQCEWIVCNYK